MNKLSIASLICLILSLKLESNENKIFPGSLFQNSNPSAFSVSSLGAPVAGYLIEGKVGCQSKGSRQRFYCHSNDPMEGFLGPQEVSKPVSLRDQPGIFPAPLRGPGSVTFTFHCQDPNTAITPIIVRPDGTIFNGLAITQKSSPQTITIASPAQTGIYTLFAVPQDQESLSAPLLVKASIDTQPQNDASFQLKTFSKNTESPEENSIDFVYINSN